MKGYNRNKVDKATIIITKIWICFLKARKIPNKIKQGRFLQASI